MSALVLAGDVGGTNARLALFRAVPAPGRSDEGATLPGQPVALEVYPSAEHGGLGEIVAAFLSGRDERPAAATVGVAGPVSGGRTAAVNLAWPVDAADLATELGLEGGSVAVINDLEANAWGIPALGPDDLATLNEGEAEPEGTVALISAGTGLGEAFVTTGPGGDRVHASEGGHVDFAPRTALERELWEHLGRDGEHVSYERACSGIGLVNVYEFLRGRGSEPEPGWLAEQRRSGDEAAAISAAGLERRDPVASEALDLLVSIYGAQAGNLALTVKATGGVYLGGGIAPKILPRLREGGFMKAFSAKGRLSGMLERIPVRVILNEQTALLGAARHALRLAADLER